MKGNGPIQSLAVVAVVGLLLAGCATSDVNPSKARTNTGYADFYAEPPADLSWEVAQFDEHAQEFRPHYSDLEPPQGGFLRLALAPGLHRLRVAILNRAIAGPTEVEVKVEDGKITPVKITLTDAGTAQVQTKETTLGGTGYGRYGRRTTFGSYGTSVYRLSAEASPGVAYQLKNQMSYARPVPN